MIRAVLPESIALAEAPDSVADVVADLIDEPANPSPFRKYYVTDVPRGFAKVAARFLGSPIGPPIEVDL